jgi:hypothetical protein
MVISLIRVVVLLFVPQENDLACTMPIAKLDVQTLRGLEPMPVSNTSQKMIKITL